MERPIVSVKTLTYNHAPYIEKCIEGILMQKTNFIYELVIGEDCSTDETRAICKRYAEKYSDVIKLVLSDKNVGATENSKRTYAECQGKYIAFCEGDDYWTDPYKLQKQVDFLEANSDYGLVHTNYSVLNNQSNKLRSNSKNIIPTGEILRSLLIDGNHIATLTVLVRAEILKKSSDIIYEPSLRNKWSMGDYPLWLCIAQQSKVGYINELTSVYRELENSASHSANGSKEFMILESICNIGRWFCDKYNFNDYLPIINENELFIGYHLSLLFNSEDKNLYRKKVRKHKIIQKNFRNIVLYIASVSLLFQRLLSYLKV